MKVLARIVYVASIVIMTLFMLYVVLRYGRFMLLGGWFVWGILLALFGLSGLILMLSKPEYKYEDEYK